MKVLLSGASGLVGSALMRHICRGGFEVKPLVRGEGEGIPWDPVSGRLDEKALRRWGEPEAVIHLAGENIASRRWSKEQKRRIRESRVEATEKLARELLKYRPQIFICASAVGIYGDRGDEILTEESSPGTSFLSEVATGWERACDPLGEAGARVANLRFGMILSETGGALAKMLPLFRFGLGGRLGSGKQWVSWIALTDVLRVIDFCLHQPLSGPLNTVSPNPVTNLEFTRELAKAVQRPAVIPAPGVALRLGLGEMADALLLSSQRAVPKRLEDAGFRFEYPTVGETLRNLLQ